MTRFKLLSSAAALAAAVSMASAPIMAAEMPVAPPSYAPPAFATFDADSENADGYRRYRNHRNRGVDAGDVLAGVLILGGIAAIASAASEPRRQARSYPQPQPDYRTRSSNSGQGIDRAVDMCLQEIERNVRVDSVDSVDRTGAGWNVTGQLYNGDAFACQIGNNGRVSAISYGDQARSYNDAYNGAYTGQQSEDRQYSAERYAEMRRQADNQGAQYSQDAQYGDAVPSYPGGPVNGQDYAEDGFGG